MNGLFIQSRIYSTKTYPANHIFLHVNWAIINIIPGPRNHIFFNQILMNLMSE